MSKGKEVIYSPSHKHANSLMSIPYRAYVSVFTLNHIPQLVQLIFFTQYYIMNILPCQNVTVTANIYVELAGMHAKSLQSCLTLCNSMDYGPPGASVYGDYPERNSGVGCHAALLQIFQTQGSNPCLLCLLHWPAGSLCLLRA